ncbi:hypothetical protein KF707_17840 [Candidatus Obscuribacterales bacterium]|nr:hypothetical protein [Candidatus Obscuribacterales bacterium]
MTRNVAALMSLAVVFSGSFALSTESAEAKTSRKSSHSSKNYLVPPPPPYIPTLVPSALGMTYVQAVTADGSEAVVKQPVNPYSQYIFSRDQRDMVQVVQPKPNVSESLLVEKKLQKQIQKQIDSFDSEISTVEKEIGNLLNL